MVAYFWADLAPPNGTNQLAQDDSTQRGSLERGVRCKLAALQDRSLDVRRGSLVLPTTMFDLQGKRRRYFRERKLAEANAGKPVKKDVSPDARRRLVREIDTRATAFSVHAVGDVSFFPTILERVREITGIDMVFHGPEALAATMPVDDFLQFLEIAMEMLWSYRHNPTDVDALQSILADDVSAFRFRAVEEPDAVHLELRFEIHEIDNAHLTREVVDKTFELTTAADFASAQRDYAEAWRNYARGDLDGALVDAHKAFESAAKVIIKRVDPTSNPEQMQTNQLVPELKRLDILPGRLGNLLTPLTQVFQNAGALRNAPGTGHGSLDLASPEANAALLGLHLSGSLVFFLAQRWETMKPRS